MGNTITSRQESPVGEAWLLFVALIYGTKYVTTGHGKYFQSIRLSLGDVSKSNALDWPEGKGSESGLVKALLCHYTISPGHFASMLS